MGCRVYPHAKPSTGVLTYIAALVDDGSMLMQGTLHSYPLTLDPKLLNLNPEP